MTTPLQSKLVNQMIELNSSLALEKDALRKLELKIELIHVKEELKKIIGEVELNNLLSKNNFK